MLAADTGISLIKIIPADRLLTETDAPFTDVDNRKTEQGEDDGDEDVEATPARRAVGRGPRK